MREEEIINYTELADQRIIEIFKIATIEMPDAERLFSHVLNAQHIWAQRISGKKPLYGVWDLHAKEKFESIAADNFKSIREALKNTALDKRILYTTTQGVQYENRLDEILFHLFNHSTYHRGQVVTLLKKEGFTPPVTDYIMLKRDHLL
ncbi:damage-inducible protein DinB [Pedobacter psychrodurus]|uniref:Damage-inducible protein DinB n=1 Tax=Pedobacter psychrodurus TaxID=2530456 RepID=A0A4R0PV21_9SPHI|nr:DinB family protein [Pedobacter psychrodurus]TCD21040.1 damage-inducible protein DinB [Pedobacter psychrodurus]